jgi:surfactin synthase thioesterase subunit
VTDPGDWFVPLAGDTGTRMYGFPHAGAGCAQLAGFAKSLHQHGIAVWSANLPGRQARLGEPARTDFTTLADELTDALAAELGRRPAPGPYLLFGYCGGALLAYGVLRRLRDRSLPLPARLVVASYEAPDIARRPYSLARLPSAALWSYLTETGGVPPDLGTNAKLRDLAEPAIRADFTMLGGYRHEPGLPLPVPITVCHGGEDQETRRGALLGWRRHSTYPIDLRAVDGGHWLVEDACEELVRTVLSAVVPEPADVT